MISGRCTSILLALLLVLLPGTVAAEDYATTWGVFSTATTISAIGTGNETVSIEYITYDDGLAKKTEWVSSQTLDNPSALSWSSKLNLGLQGDSFWWDFQDTGLPRTWEKTETILPFVAPEIQKPIPSPITSKYPLTPTASLITMKKLLFF
ncbi:MAG: hypothetical protein WBJ52_03355 [Methanoregulaceae archaeon]